MRPRPYVSFGPYVSPIFPESYRGGAVKQTHAVNHEFRFDAVCGLRDGDADGCRNIAISLINPD